MAYLLQFFLSDELVFQLQLLPLSVGDAVLGNGGRQVHPVVEVSTPKYIVMSLHRLILRQGGTLYKDTQQPMALDDDHRQRDRQTDRQTDR